MRVRHEVESVLRSLEGVVDELNKLMVETSGEDRKRVNDGLTEAKIRLRHAVAKIETIQGHISGLDPELVERVRGRTIDELGLSFRVKHALRRQVVYSLADLLAYDPIEIMNIRMIGLKSTVLIQKALAQAGFHLRPVKNPQHLSLLSKKEREELGLENIVPFGGRQVK